MQAWFQSPNIPRTRWRPGKRAFEHVCLRWFALITQRAIRRGSFCSVKDLIQKIDAFVQHYNRSSRPSVWTATADSILEKITRLCSRISGTQH